MCNPHREIIWQYWAFHVKNCILFCVKLKFNSVNIKKWNLFGTKVEWRIKHIYIWQSFQMVKWKGLNLLHLLHHAYFSVDNNKFIWNSKATVTDKLNLSLWMPWWQGSKGTVPHILSFSTTWRQEVNSMPWLLHAQWNTPWYPLHRRQHGVPQLVWIIIPESVYSMTTQKNQRDWSLNQ